jgi:hypothetical protein
MSEQDFPVLLREELATCLSFFILFSKGTFSAIRFWKANPSWFGYETLEGGVYVF